METKDENSEDPLVYTQKVRGSSPRPPTIQDLIPGKLYEWSAEQGLSDPLVSPSESPDSASSVPASQSLLDALLGRGASRAIIGGEL